MEKGIAELQEEIKSLKAYNEILKKKNEAYEIDGPYKLYFALNRKSVEMANLLNSTVLDQIDISSKEDKTFDRMKVLWGEAKSLSDTIQQMKLTLGISEDDAKEENVKRHTVSPETIANTLGDNKPTDV